METGFEIPREIKLSEPICLTVYDPEPIPELMLKFRDLQSLWLMFRGYTFEYTRTIETDHARCDEGAVDHQAPRERTERNIETIARIMLSAFLSAYGSLLYYARDAMISESSRKWLRREKGRRPLLDSFERLRNREVHSMSLSTLIGVRYLVDRISTMPTDEDPNVSHVHWESLHQGAGFVIDALRSTEQFKGRPDLVKLLTDKSILDLAHDCIHEISALLHEAMILSHWKAADRAFLCWICRRLRETDHA